jgi:hypothetical protein
MRGETIMKVLLLATVLSLAASGNLAFAQAPAAQDPHHPPQAVAPSEPAPPPAGPEGMMSGMPMMGDMRMANMMRMMGMMRGAGGAETIDRIEGRIAFLRTELKITEVQSDAWNAFADALRANARKLGEVRADMMAQPAAGHAPTLVDRLDLQERWLLARLEGTRTIKSALAKLTETLSDEQKKAAGELLAPHMGMGVMTMGGQMPSGMMQPGQMRPKGMRM